MRVKNYFQNFIDRENGTGVGSELCELKNFLRCRSLWVAPPSLALARGGRHRSFMKRFTETTKWEDPWFRKLNPTSKLLWQWLLDHCDNAGVVDPDLELASFQIGQPIEAEHVAELASRFQTLPDGKLHITKFVKFQFGELRTTNRVHLSVARLVRLHGLTVNQSQGDVNGIAIPLVSPKDKDKDKRKDKDKEKEKEKDKDEPDQNKCAYCGSTEDQVGSRHQVEHFNPRCAGGESVPENLLTACAVCNNTKQGRVFESIEDCRTWLHWRFWSSGRNRYYAHRQHAFGGIAPSAEETERGVFLHANTTAQPENSRLLGTSQMTTPPDLEEIFAYCREIGLPVEEGQKFFDHFESNGWKVGGKAPMKNWKAALRTWKSRHIPIPNGTVPSGGADPTTSERIQMGKEYERVIERLRVLRSTYGEMQTWTDGDVKERSLLIARKKHLKEVLGILI